MPEMVSVKGDTLVWARLSLGLSREEAAQLLNVANETLQDWENNGASLGVTRLRTIAAKYKRPVAVFLRSTTPTLPGGPEDFRTIGGVEPHLSFETLVAIRDAQRVQAIAGELLELDPELYPAPPLTEANLQLDSAEELGATERLDHFLVTKEDQLRRWTVPNAAYNAWRARIQTLGILVLAKTMPRIDCRGFSLRSAGMPPVIVVNQKEVDQAKSFTLMHEYAHLLLQRQGLCLERENVDKRSVERWCNEFAASALVPTSVLSEEVPYRRLTLEDVAQLARRFKVSRHVIALSLRRIGRAQESLYEELKRQDEEVDWSESIPVSAEDAPHRNQAQLLTSELGIAYPTIVLRALERQLITVSDACDFLDARAETVDELKRRTNQAALRYGRRN